jgi:hypothetical protein
MYLRRATKAFQVTCSASRFQPRTRPNLALSCPKLRTTSGGWQPINCAVLACVQETMEQYRALVAELEALLPAQLSRKQQQYQQEDGDGGGAAAALAALPVVLNNLHDFFNNVAARLEKLHDGVAAARDAFLELRRQVGHIANSKVGGVTNSDQNMMK